MSDPPVPDLDSNEKRKPSLTQSSLRRGTRFTFESNTPAPPEGQKPDAQAPPPASSGLGPAGPAVPASITGSPHAAPPPVDDSIPTRILGVGGVARPKATDPLPGHVPPDESRPTVIQGGDIARIAPQKLAAAVTHVGTAPGSAAAKAAEEERKKNLRKLIFGTLKEPPAEPSRPIIPEPIETPALQHPVGGGQKPPGSGHLPATLGSVSKVKMTAEEGLAAAQSESGTRFGDFELLKALTAGGFGDVWIALDTVSGKEVVLKRLRAEQAELKRAFYQFDIEIEIGQRVKHPNLVPILQSGVIDGRRFFTMPRIPGPSLTQILQKKTVSEWVLTENEILAALEMIGRALGFLHRAGVIHCDLKPDNILFSARNRPMLIDLGIARTVNWQQTGYRALKGFREDKSILGTPEYMAPELFLGENEQIGFGADLYAMGVILYEVLCGVPPFKRVTNVAGVEGTKALMDLMDRVQQVPPRAVSEIRPQALPALAELAMKCLSKDAGARPKSADDFAVAIGRVLRPATLPVATGKPSALGAIGKLLRKPDKP